MIVLVVTSLPEPLELPRRRAFTPDELIRPRHRALGYRTGCVSDGS